LPTTSTLSIWRIAIAHAQFAHFRGEGLKPETRWRREVDSNQRYRLLDAS
jgi:hypothetical protein